MRAGQRKCVVEACRRPGARRVALCTVLRKAETGMVRSTLIIRAVTGVAVRSESSEGASGMTLRTIQAGMAARQGKARVIKRARCPGSHGVTLGTVLRKAEAGMVLCALIIGTVAGVTVRAESGVDTSGMTLGTIQTTVSTC